jgi:hypothetical protein
MRISWTSKTLGLLAMALAGGGLSYGGTFYGTSIPIPAGLVEGDTFQFVFVTSETYAATSTNISDYNADVTTSANEPTSLVNGLGITWSVLGSTAAVNVLQNIVNTSPGTPGFGGIFDLGGNQIADGTETTPNGLYSGNLQNPLDMTEYGTTVPLNTSLSYAFTGTDAGGTTSAYPLGGSSTFVSIGLFGWTNGYWTQHNPELYDWTYYTYSLYAISNPLELGPNNTLEVVTPEPATDAMTLLGLAVCYLTSRRTGRTRGHR